jgi:hypothetical protein
MACCRAARRSLFTNNDDGWRTVEADLAGSRHIAAVVDPRGKDAGGISALAEDRRCACFAGGVVSASRAAAMACAASS